MALSTTIRGTAMIPPLRLIYGDWTGSSGDASGTVAIGSGYPVMAIFQKFNTGNTFQLIPRVTVSVSSGIATFTIENQDDVTTGRFVILVAGS